jgi:hypothetical protein
VIDDAVRGYASFATLLLSNGFKFFFFVRGAAGLKIPTNRYDIIDNEYTRRGKTRRNAARFISRRYEFED